MGCHTLLIQIYSRKQKVLFQTLTDWCVVILEPNCYGLASWAVQSSTTLPTPLPCPLGHTPCHTHNLCPRLHLRPTMCLLPASSSSHPLGCHSHLPHDLCTPPQPSHARSQCDAPHTARSQCDAPHTARSQCDGPHTARSQCDAPHTARSQCDAPPHTARSQCDAPPTLQGHSVMPGQGKGQGKGRGKEAWARPHLYSQQR